MPKEDSAKTTGGAGAKKAAPRKEKSKYRTLIYAGTRAAEITARGSRRRVKPGDKVKLLRAEAEAELSRSGHLWNEKDGGK